MCLTSIMLPSPHKNQDKDINIFKKIIFLCSARVFRKSSLPKVPVFLRHNHNGSYLSQSLQKVKASEYFLKPRNIVSSKFYRIHN